MVWSVLYYDICIPVNICETCWYVYMLHVHFCAQECTHTHTHVLMFVDYMCNYYIIIYSLQVDTCSYVGINTRGGWFDINTQNLHVLLFPYAQVFGLSKHLKHLLLCLFNYVPVSVVTITNSTNILRANVVRFYSVYSAAHFPGTVW